MRSLFTNYLEPVSFAILAIAVLLYILSRHGKVKIWVLFLTNILSAIAMFLACTKVIPSVNNILEYDILLLVTSVGLGTYFFIFFQSRIHKWLSLLLATGGAVHFFIRDLHYHDTATFDSIGYYVVSLYIIILVFIAFRRFLKDNSGLSITREFDFWVMMSLFIHRVGSITIFLSLYALTNMVSKEEHSVSVGNLWAGQNIFLLLSSLSLLAGVLWINLQKK